MAMRRSLVNRGEIRPGPLRIHDELERVEGLMPHPEPVEGVSAEVGERAARRVGQEPEIGELQRLVALRQEGLAASHEGRLLAAGQEGDLPR
jgi:hypothetical protein